MTVRRVRGRPTRMFPHARFPRGGWPEFHAPRAPRAALPRQRAPRKRTRRCGGSHGMTFASRGVLGRLSMTVYCRRPRMPRTSRPPVTQALRLPTTVRLISVVGPLIACALRRCRRRISGVRRRPGTICDASGMPGRYWLRAYEELSWRRPSPPSRPCSLACLTPTRTQQALTLPIPHRPAYGQNFPSRLKYPYPTKYPQTW